jgi:hypothetical protein
VNVILFNDGDRNLATLEWTPFSDIIPTDIVENYEFEPDKQIRIEERQEERIHTSVISCQMKIIFVINLCNV